MVSLPGLTQPPTGQASVMLTLLLKLWNLGCITFRNSKFSN